MSRVSTYHGTPKDLPSTSVVFCAPPKNCEASIDLGVGSSASRPANSPIQVVPTIAASGVLPAVMAVVNLSCAASHGIAVTLTLAPGLAASKSLARAGSFSPSAPMAQTVIVPVALPELMSLPVSAAALPPLSRPHAVSVRAAAVMVATAIAEVRLIGVSLFHRGEGDGREGSGVRRWGVTRGALGLGADGHRRRRAAAGGADDQVGRDDLGAAGGGRAGDALVEEVGGAGAELAHRLADRREPGLDVASGHHVVPAHDRDVLRDAQHAAAQPHHDGEGELVVG